VVGVLIGIGVARFPDPHSDATAEDCFVKHWSVLALLTVAFCLALPEGMHAQGPTSAGAPAPGAGEPDLRAVASGLNMSWLLVCAFLVFFMQAGFALVETGMTRAKNVAHTMAMNVMVYLIGVLGFWFCGFALMFGAGLTASGAGASEVVLPLFGMEFGLFGSQGFFLAGATPTAAMLGLFLFHVMFMDTAATIPTGTLAERWKFASFMAFAFFMSMVIYPIYGHWVWGNGWLAQLGTNFGLGHGHVDFAGSSVVHMVGGFSGLAGAVMLGSRLGKFRSDGHPNPLPAHNVPMYMLGTLVLAFGWFGFNTGGSRPASDLNVARVAVNTALAAAAGGFTSLCIMWSRFRKPDPSFLCNGLLAGLVAITAGCAYVAPWAAVLIGAAAGCLVVWSCLFLERRLGLDDPVGAISVHGMGGAWGVLAVGLFADGTYAPGAALNGVAGPVAGLFYGDASQLGAQAIGLAANLVWVLPLSAGFFWVAGRLVGNRVGAQVELQGLDVPELGALGYITQDPKEPQGRLVAVAPPEPRPATVPPNGKKHFSVVVDGVDATHLARTWSSLCHAGDRPPPSEFRAVYPYMTTLQGTRFRFRAGDPQLIRANLEDLLKQHLPGRSVRVRLDGGS